MQTHLYLLKLRFHLSKYEGISPLSLDEDPKNIEKNNFESFQ